MFSFLVPLGYTLTSSALLLLLPLVSHLPMTIDDHLYTPSSSCSLVQYSRVDHGDVSVGGSQSSCCSFITIVCGHTYHLRSMTARYLSTLSLPLLERIRFHLDLWRKYMKSCSDALDVRLLRLQSHTLNMYCLIILYTRIITLNFLSVTLKYVTCIFGVYRFVCGSGSVFLLLCHLNSFLTFVIMGCVEEYCDMQQ